MLNLAKILLFFLLAIRLYSETKLSVELDACSFKLDDEHLRWELYYAFPDNALRYVSGDNGYIGTLKFSVEIISSVKTEIKDEWRVEQNRKSNSDSLLQVLFGIRSYKLTYGQYEAKISIEDANNPSGALSYNFPIVLRQISSNRLEISDLLLAHIIKHESRAGEFANTLFYRNSLYVYPNPSSEFASNDPKVNVYCEIYNAKSFSKDGLQLHYRIFDGANREVFYYPKKVESYSDGIVEFVEIPMNIYPTGVYNLVLSVKAINSPDSVFSSKRFYLYNLEIPPTLDITYTESMSFEMSEFATLSEERLDLEFRKIRMIATKFDRDQYNLLTDSRAKAKFLYRFWKKRNTDTLSPINMALYEHRRRIDYANTFFSYGRRDNGWDTDRGRVLLINGDPTRRDYNPQDGNNRPWEVWFYSEIEGGVYFYFVDLGGFGNFQQVHSTKFGEFYNVNWYDQYVPVVKDRHRQPSDEDGRFR